jgi:pimeloyl-ACP methyl ester carboxylesterase
LLASAAVSELAVTTQGAGAPVLLIHGTGPAAWGELPALLAADHRVIVYDRRSFGASAAVAPPPSGLSTHAEDAAALLRAAGEPAVVVGWSMGGVIALEVAGRWPELVRALVLLEPPLHLKRHPTPSMLAAIISAIALGRLGRPLTGARRFLRWALDRPGQGSDLDRMPPEFHARLRSGDGRAVVDELAFGTGEHLDAAALGAMRLPVRVLYGSAGRQEFAGAARRLVETVLDAELVEIPGAAHAIALDAPQQVADAVSVASAAA